eukprot:Lankesteria_metandrocarpae@DN3130_c0_g1_i1.p1
MSHLATDDVYNHGAEITPEPKESDGGLTPHHFEDELVGPLGARIIKTEVAPASASDDQSGGFIKGDFDPNAVETEIERFLKQRQVFKPPYTFCVPESLAPSCGALHKHVRKYEKRLEEDLQKKAKEAHVVVSELLPLSSYPA